MKIGVLARRTGLNASAIRYYERVGLLGQPHRVGGQRRYSGEIVHRVLLIRFAATDGSPAAPRQLGSTRSAARALAMPHAKPIWQRRSLPQSAKENRRRICWRTIRRGRCMDFFAICRFASAFIKAAVQEYFGIRRQQCFSRESSGLGGC